MHFANLEQTRNEENLEDQYGQWLEKYRGKEGQIKSIGLILYYAFLRFIMVVFVILSIAALPQFILNFEGDGLRQYSNVQIISFKLMQVSLANQRQYRFDTLGTQELHKIIFNKNVIIWNDIFCIAICMVAIAWWKVKSHRLLGQYIVKCPAPWLYTLQVSDLPKNITLQKLYNHFSYFGKVRQIEPIRNHESNLIIMKSLVNLIYRFKISDPNSKAQKQIMKSISNIYGEIAQHYLSKNVPKIQSAFIAFDSIDVRNRTEQLYRYQINPPKLYLDYKFPTVKKCHIDPLTINWENYHLKNKYHNKKNICQGMLVVVMLTVIVLALFILNLSLNRLRTSVKKYQSMTPANFQYLDLSDESIMNTFCASLTLQKFKWSYYSFCSSYFNNYTNQFMLMVAFSLLVVVINLLTNRILRELVEFRRYKTIAQKNKFLISAIFFFSLINSGILIILVRSQYIGPALSWVVGKTFNFQEQFLKVQTFKEFNRQWYLTVGNQLIFNFVITLIVCPYLYIIKYWLKKVCRKKTATDDKRSNQPDFDYCTFYAMSLKAIFFCLFYSQAMPILYPLAIVSIIVQYTLSHCLMKYFVREPMFFDTTANETVIRILPYALLIHTFLSIMFINVNDIFPNKSSYDNKDTDIYTILTKFKQGYIHCFVFLILLICTLYRQQIYKLIIQYIQPFAPSYSKTFKQIARNPSFLSSYRMRDNPKYKIVSYALQLFEKHMRILAIRSPGTQSNFLSNAQIYDYEVPKSMQSMSSIIDTKENVIC